MAGLPPTNQQSAIQKLRGRVGPADIYTIELVQAICALWCAKCLFTPPSNFDVTSPLAYSLVRQVCDSEDFWAWFCLIWGALPLIGLILLALDCWWPGLARTFRMTGLSMLSFFFVLLGLSWFIGNPDSLASPFITILGIRGWEMLLIKAGITTSQNAR